MFVQLRRVVYLLVLLQCCACVAYAESSEEDAVTTKMKVKLRELNITAEQLLANGRVVFSALQENVLKLKDLSGEVEFVAEKAGQLVENRSKRDTPNGEDASDEGTIKEMVGHIKDLVPSVARTTVIVKLAMEYCKNWSDILDKVIADCGEPACQHISSESDGDFLDMEPEVSYEYFYHLRAHMIEAMKRGNDTVKKIEQHEQTVEDALGELEVVNEALMKEMNEIQDDAEKKSAASFQKYLKEEVETLLREITKEHGETAGQIRNKGQSGDAASGPMSSTAVLAVLALTVSTVIGMTVV